MLTGTVIKGIGLAATAIGVGATLVTDWVNEKKMEEKIDEKINKRFAEKRIEES
jgi:peptide deformylase